MNILVAVAAVVAYHDHEWPRATKLAAVTLISALAAAIDMVCACVSLSRVAIKNGPGRGIGQPVN